MNLYDIDGNMLIINSTTSTKNVDINEKFYKTQFVAHAVNSIARFNECIGNGYDFIECDVTFTEDDVPLLSHDSVVTSNGESINITEKTYDELLDLGLSLDKLEELVYLCKNKNICLYIDVKNASNERVDVLYDLIQKTGMIRCTVFGSLNVIQKNYLCTKDAHVIVDSTMGSLALVDQAYSLSQKCAMCIGHISHSVTTPEAMKEVVEYAHKKGLLIYPWTIDNSDTANAYFDIGADWVMTNKLLNQSD